MIIKSTTINLLIQEKVTKKQKQKIINSTSPILSPKLAYSKILLPTIVLMENSPCTFQGNMPDQDNCQCKKSKQII